MEWATADRETEYQSLRRLMRQTEANTPTARRVADALREELTPRQAQMVRLYYMEQRSMAAVAELLGVNTSTVCRTLQAARRKLRRCLRYSDRALLRED